MKKVFILIIALFFITGCTVNYHIEINEDLTVHETAYIEETKDFYKSFNKTTKPNALKSVYDIYEETLKEKGYNASLTKTGEPHIDLDRKYNGLDEYLSESLLFNDFFEEITYDKKGDHLIIETNGFNKNDPDNPERFYCNKLDIAITPAFKVIDSNASKIDKETNTYHFIMTESMDDFSIYLDLDTSKRFNRYEELIIMVVLLAILILATWIISGIINKKKK